MKLKHLNLFTSYEDNLNTHIYCRINHNGIINGSIIFQTKQGTSDKQKILNKDYYENNKVDLKLKRAQYYKDNTKKIKTHNRKYYESNKEYIKEWYKLYYINDKEKIKLKKLQYYKDNKEFVKESVKLWQKTNLDKVRIMNIKKRVIRKGWGYEPINQYFDGAHFHHMHTENHAIGIYIPEAIHRSIWHKYNDKELMDKINTSALEWLCVQEIL